MDRKPRWTKAFFGKGLHLTGKLENGKINCSTYHSPPIYISGTISEENSLTIIRLRLDLTPIAKTINKRKLASRFYEDWINRRCQSDALRWITDDFSEFRRRKNAIDSGRP